MEEYLPIDGTIIEIEELTKSRAREALEAVLSSDFCRLVNVYVKADKSEVIEFDTEVEVGQFPRNDVMPTERVAAEFGNEAIPRPRVYVLRGSFPHLPHMNLESKPLPRSLCLYEQAPEEVDLFWTGFTFVERIREWLKLSAVGELHQEDQPLEPFIIGYHGTLVLPRLTKSSDLVFLNSFYIQNDGKVNLFLHSEPLHGFTNLPCSLILVETPPVTHGVLHHAPNTLLDVVRLLASAGLDLSNKIIEHLKHVYQHHPKNRILFLVSLPKKRQDDEEVSSTEYHAFITAPYVEQICLEIGLYEKNEYGNGLVLGFSLNEEHLNKIGIEILRPIFQFTPLNGQIMNSVPTDSGNVKVCAIGMGALGSQVFLNCIRAGYGHWVLIDHDCLWPHNLSRHALSGIVGIPKATNLSVLANTMVNKEVSKAIVGNLVTDVKEMFASDLTAANLILDMSASPSVLKRLSSDPEIESRIVSVFLNASGSDLVILSEDADLKVRIDHLEAQYFRSLFSNTSLSDHMLVHGKVVRYSNSCSDVSAVIPQDRIALHSAIASAQIKNICTEPGSSIRIFKMIPDTNEVSRVDVPTSETQEVDAGAWTLIYDKYLLDKVYDWREKRLPNETGGVLLGSVDMLRRRIYVLDTILSPKDSMEYPTAYVRGIDGLEETRKKILDLTGGQVQYVGEWHSHPKGHGSAPSSDDLKLFLWLKGNMAKIGMPPLMLIAGSNYDYRFIIE